MHMVFTCNPGTGKTVMARLVGKVLRAHGLLRLGNFAPKHRADVPVRHGLAPGGTERRRRRAASEEDTPMVQQGAAAARITSRLGARCFGRGGHTARHLRRLRVVG